MFGVSYIKFSSVLVSRDPEPPDISILCEWSGICSHFGLCFVWFLPVILSKLIIFVCYKDNIAWNYL